MHRVFEATMESLPKMLQLIRCEARCAGFSGASETKIEVALEEAIVNIILHGYNNQAGKIVICCSKISDKGLKFNLFDRGIPFTPSLKNSLGGCGVRIIFSIMNEVVYQRQGDTNVLTLSKYLNK